MLKDVSNHKIRCEDDSAQIIFDNATLEMAGDYSFTVGSFSVYNTLVLNGPHTFLYESGLTSTIDSGAKILVGDKATFSIGRKEANGREPLYFEDSTSHLELDNSTLTITPSGATLTRGTFVINRDSTFDILSTSTVGGLVLGDGAPANDFSITMNPASSLTFPQGHFSYQNATPAFFDSKVSNASVYYGDDIHFYVFKSFLYKNITAYPSLTSSIYVDPSVFFTTQNYTENFLGNEYVITGTIPEAAHITLEQNDSVFLKNGECPHAINVVGSGNIISGVGTVGGELTLEGPGSELTWDVQGPLPNHDINLNGGRIIITQDSSVISPNSFTSTGTVDLTNRTIEIGSDYTDWSGDIYWIGDGAKIVCNGDILLSGKWTFSGDITLESNYILDFGETGTLLLERGAQVTFDTLSLWNVSRHHGLICSDDNVLVTCNYMDFVLSGDYVFDKGSIFVYWNSTIMSIGDFDTEYNFLYESTQPSTIDAYAKLTIGSGARFSIGRQDSTITDPEQQPLVFNDQITSILELDGGTLNITSSGMIFAGGTIDVISASKIVVDTPKYEYGLILGDGTAENDHKLNIRSGVQLTLESGNVYYNNYQQGRVVFESPSSVFNIAENGSFVAKTDCKFQTGSVASVSGLGIALNPDPGTIFITENYTEKFQGSEYVFTGTIADQAGQIIFGDNDKLNIINGTCPYDIYVVGSSNRITGLGFIDGQIIFEGPESELIWDVPAPLPNHDINLNGGLIRFTQDSGITSTNSFTQTGTIDLTDRSFTFGSGYTDWTGDLYWISDGGKIKFNTDVVLSGKWTFSGDIIVQGGDYTLDFLETGTLLLERGAQVSIEHLSLWNVSSNHGIKCSDNDGFINLNVADFILSGDYVFDKGSIFVYWDSTVQPIGELGTTNTFEYKSTQPFTIDSFAKFSVLRGANFAIGRQDSTITDTTQQPLLFNDPNTATLALNGGALTITSSGMIVTRGNIDVVTSSTLSVQTPKYEYGLIFGDGTADDDCILRLASGAQLNVESGKIYYNNYSPDRIVFNNQIASLTMHGDSGLVAKTDVTLKDGSISTDTSPHIAITSDLGVGVIQDNIIRTYHGYPYSIQKRKLRGAESPFELYDGDYYFVTEGHSPDDVIAAQGVTAFGGTGGFVGNLSLQNHTVTVHCLLASPFFNDVALNGGTIFYDTDGLFAADTTLTGSGKVQFPGTHLLFGPLETNMTNTIYWQGLMSGGIDLGAKTNLSGTWSFGNSIDIDGHGNVFDLSTGGVLKIRPNSTLSLSNMALKGLGTGKGTIEFMSDSSQLQLSNVYLELDNDFSTTIGGIVVNGPTTVGLKDYNWILDQNASMTIDGTTLWQDSLDKVSGGNIIFGAGLKDNYLSLVSSGTIKTLSNLDSLNTATTLLQIQIKNNSNAILGFDQRVTNNSNAIVMLDRLTGQNSNSILAIDLENELATYNSNLLLGLTEKVKNNSDTIVYDNQRITNNSNAIMSDFLTDDHLVVLGAVQGDLILKKSRFIQPGEAIHFVGDTSLEGSGALWVFSDPAQSQFVIDPYVTVRLKNMSLSMINGNTFSLGEGSKLIIDHDVLFELEEDIVLGDGQIVLDSQDGETVTFVLRGIGGIRQLELFPFFEDVTTLIDVSDHLMMLENIELVGLEYATKQTGALVLSGASTVHIVQDSTMDFDAEGVDNKLVFERNDLLFGGMLLFGTGELAENVLHLSIRPEGGLITNPTINFADEAVFLGTAGPGQASLIFDDFFTRVNNLGENSFVTFDYATLAGQNVFLTGYPIKQTSFDLRLDSALRLQSEVTMPNAIDFSFIREARSENVRIKALRSKLNKALKRVREKRNRDASLFKPEKKKKKKKRRRTRDLETGDLDTRIMRLNPELFTLPEAVDTNVTCQLKAGQSSGVIQISEGGVLTDFGISQDAPLDLYMTGNATLIQGESDVEFKSEQRAGTDTLSIAGSGNLIIVNSVLKVNANSVTLDANSDVEIKLDDKNGNAACEIQGTDLAMPAGARITFSGKGTVKFSGTSFNLEFGDTTTKATLVIADGAQFLPPAGMVMSGNGKIVVKDSGGIYLNQGSSLLVGTVDTDNFVFEGRTGVIGLGKSCPVGTGADPCLTFKQGSFEVDFEHEALWYVDNGMFEIGTLAAPVTLKKFSIHNESVFRVGSDGKFKIWKNKTTGIPAAEEKFVFDFVRGYVKGDGIVTYGEKVSGVEKSEFVGTLQIDSVNLTCGQFTSFDLVSNLIGTNKDKFKYGTVAFVDKDGNYKIRLKNGNVVALCSGWIPYGDYPDGSIDGSTAEGYLFTYDVDGNPGP
ncbi:MAG: hypothetical protein V1855_01410 [bacterium]